MVRCKVSAHIGVRGVAGVGVWAALLLAAAPAQAAFIPGRGDLTCGPHMDIYGKEVPSNLTVPPGGTCNLIEESSTQPTIVDGNVTVGQNSRFTVYGSIIKGNLSSEGAEQVNLIGSVVEGNAIIDATNGAEGTFFCGLHGSVCLLASGFGRNLIITNTSPPGAVVAGSLIERNLICTGNASVGNPLKPDTVLGQELGQCVGL
jgi:hypothetical protein